MITTRYDQRTEQRLCWPQLRSSPPYSIVVIHPPHFGRVIALALIRNTTVVGDSQGLKAVREGDGGTVADEGVQRPIRQRIEGYPEKAKANMHHARLVFVNTDYLLSWCCT